MIRHLPPPFDLGRLPFPAESIVRGILSGTDVASAQFPGLRDLVSAATEGSCATATELRDLGFLPEPEAIERIRARVEIVPSPHKHPSLALRCPSCGIFHSPTAGCVACAVEAARGLWVVDNGSSALGRTSIITSPCADEVADDARTVLRLLHAVAVLSEAPVLPRNARTALKLCTVLALQRPLANDLIGIAVSAAAVGLTRCGELALNRSHRSRGIRLLGYAANYGMLAFVHAPESDGTTQCAMLSHAARAFVCLAKASVFPEGLLDVASTLALQAVVFSALANRYVSDVETVHRAYQVICNALQILERVKLDPDPGSCSDLLLWALESPLVRRVVECGSLAGSSKRRGRLSHVAARGPVGWQSRRVSNRDVRTSAILDDCVDLARRHEMVKAARMFRHFLAAPPSSRQYAIEAVERLAERLLAEERLGLVKALLWKRKAWLKGPMIPVVSACVGRLLAGASDVHAVRFFGTARARLEVGIRCADAGVMGWSDALERLLRKEVEVWDALDADDSADPPVNGARLVHCVSRHNALLDGGLSAHETSIHLDRLQDVVIIEVVILDDGLCRIVRESGRDPKVEWHCDSHYLDAFRTLHESTRRVVSACELEAARGRPVELERLRRFRARLLSVTLGRGNFCAGKRVLVVGSDAGLMDIPWAFPLCCGRDASQPVYQLPSLVGIRPSPPSDGKPSSRSALILADNEPLFVLRGGLVDRLRSRFRGAGWDVGVWRGRWENDWREEEPSVVLILGHGEIDEDSEQQLGLSVGGALLTPNSMSATELSIGGRTVSLRGARLVVLGGCVAGRTSADAGANVLPMARALVRRGTAVVAPLSRFVIDPRGRSGRATVEVMLEKMVDEGVTSGFADGGRLLALARVEAERHGSTWEHLMWACFGGPL